MLSVKYANEKMLKALLTQAARNRYTKLFSRFDKRKPIRDVVF